MQPLVDIQLKVHVAVGQQIAHLGILQRLVGVDRAKRRVELALHLGFRRFGNEDVGPAFGYFFENTDIVFVSNEMRFRQISFGMFSLYASCYAMRNYWQGWRPLYTSIRLSTVAQCFWMGAGGEWRRTSQK